MSCHSQSPVRMAFYLIFFSFFLCMLLHAVQVWFVLWIEGFLTALCSCLHLLCRWIRDYTFSVHMSVFVCALILHVGWIFPHVSIWWRFGKRGGKTKTEIGLLIYFFFTASLSRDFYVGASCCWGSSRSASSPRYKSAKGLVKLLPKQVGSKAKPSF